MDIFAELPNTPLDWILEVTVCTLVSLIVLSFTEYYIHKYSMHVKILPRKLYAMIPLLENVWSAHVRVHHTVYAEDFTRKEESSRTDDATKIPIFHTVLALAGFSPLLLASAVFVSSVFPFVFVLLILMHRIVWNMIHTEMHLPQHPAWTGSRLYTFLARHHYMHHKNPGTNFNIVLPLADYLLHKNTVPEESDTDVLRELGYKRR